MTELDAFEQRVTETLRWYADDVTPTVDAAEVAHRVALEHPRPRKGVIAWRPAALPRVALVLVLLASLLVALVGGMLIVGSQPVRKLPEVVPPIGQVFTCPPGTNPDEPGPVDQTRPPMEAPVAMAFDRHAGKLVVLVRANKTWTFDVCTNTWAAMHPASEPSLGFMGMLAYDTAARRTILMSSHGGAWAYDLASDTWTMRPGVPNVEGGVRLAYDSGAARVVALQVKPPHPMWMFDGVADTWEPVEQSQNVWPVPPEDSNLSNLILLAYDASVDRLVGYDVGEVRLFDLRTGTWSPPGTTPPPFGYGGYYSLGGEIAYDEAARRTVLFSLGQVIAYDAAADRWETLYGPPTDGCGIRPECRSQPNIIYDPINERIVVYGGNVHTGAEWPGWWGPSDDVLAFDTHTREWTVLLEASRPVTPGLSPSPGN